MYTTRRTKILHTRFPKRVSSTQGCAGQGHLSGSVGQLFVMVTCFTQQYSLHFMYTKVSNVGRLNSAYVM